MVRRLLCCLVKGVNDEIRSRHVGIADAEGNDVDPLRRDFAFGFVDGGEKVRGQTGDSFGKFEIGHEELLKILQPAF
jgi:hypothetical protein